MDSHAWDARYAGSELVWREGPNEFVEAELGDLPPGTAVDLAAGEGRNALWLARKGWRVTAVDFSPVGLEKGRRMLREHGGPLAGSVEWVCADVTSWVAPAPVDLALVAYLQLPADDGHGGEPDRTAWDVLVRLVRRQEASRGPERSEGSEGSPSERGSSP